MKIINNKLILIIFGPTGVGKTELALQVAQHIESEIVNMDVGQFYTPFSIGTAKPNYKKSTIPHHLFDIIDKPKQLTVVAYRNMLINTINSIWKNKKLPIIVGGSGFYLKSLFFPPRTIERTKLVGTININNSSWNLLKEIDPVRAAQINKKDKYRINRALTIWRLTGQLPSTCLPLFNPVSNCLLTFVGREKDELYSRIDNRVVQMIDEGWISEVQNLQKTQWVPFIRSKKIIGYNDILDYLASDQTKRTKEHMISIIQKKTKNYAKRQYTFWRMLKKKLKEVPSLGLEKNILFEETNLTFTPLHLYIKQLLERLLVLNKKENRV